MTRLIADGMTRWLTMELSGWVPTVEMILGCLFAAALLTASVADIRTGLIPQNITGSVLILGITRMLLYPGEWGNHLLGLVSVSGALFLLLIMTGGTVIGGGDVKLLAGCGLFLGFEYNLIGFLISCVCGSVIHLFRMAFFHAGRSFAMGPYLAIGALAAYLWGDRILVWWLQYPG